MRRIIFTSDFIVNVFLKIKADPVYVYNTWAYFMIRY